MSEKTKPAVAFVNDWAKLKTAVNFYQNQLPNFWLIHSPECNAEMEDLEHLETIVSTVPKLLEDYGELWELAGAVISAWDQMNEGKTPGGLVVPK